MGWYERVIFNRLLDLTLDHRTMAIERKKTLAGVTGRTLEIGIGTGLNLAHYPEHIKEITNISPEKELPEIVNHRAEQNNKIINHHQGDAALLPFADSSFDSIVSTLTMCTISDMQSALREIYRVLTPDGKFFFFEHIIGKSRFTRTIQRIADPVQNVVSCGCSLCRDTAPAIKKAGFTFEQLHDYHSKAIIWPGNRIIRGIAVKPTNPHAPQNLSA